MFTAVLTVLDDLSKSATRCFDERSDAQCEFHEIFFLLIFSFNAMVMVTDDRLKF